MYLLETVAGRNPSKWCFIATLFLFFAYESCIKSVADKIFLLSQHQVSSPLPTNLAQNAVSELILHFTLFFMCSSVFLQSLQGEKISEKLVQLSVILL